ncbi:hypothetical protein PMPD1_3729 [Paramixta manurensis]|uniref:Uncharacterized protein n=1 Tax=Paramixta manurensis TaxID=2740817 RepID=A0A6M8UU95_9GAMM|nr:hypothetical protein PMPD1_3729 [Erwiniaceae bacterium PD-1]
MVILMLTISKINQHAPIANDFILLACGHAHCWVGAKQKKAGKMAENRPFPQNKEPENRSGLGKKTVLRRRRDHDRIGTAVFS